MKSFEKTKVLRRKKELDDSFWRDPRSSPKRKLIKRKKRMRRAKGVGKKRGKSVFHIVSKT